MHSTTPRAISGPIRDLCRELVSNPQPLFLQVTPLRNVEANDCFAIVERHVHNHGGSICYGWQMWEWPRVMVEAEFHAVWSDCDGGLHDLTPKQLPVERILFLPDPVRVYKGRGVNNVRRALSSHSDVAAFIVAADAEFELMNRGARAEQHGEILLHGAENEERLTIQQCKTSAYEEIVARLGPPGRNDPCPCGSGEKFKKCHGR